MQLHKFSLFVFGLALSLFAQQAVAAVAPIGTEVDINATTTTYDLAKNGVIKSTESANGGSVRVINTGGNDYVANHFILTLTPGTGLAQYHGDEGFVVNGASNKGQRIFMATNEGGGSVVTCKKIYNKVDQQKWTGTPTVLTAADILGEDKDKGPSGCQKTP